MDCCSRGLFIPGALLHQHLLKVMFKTPRLLLHLVATRGQQNTLRKTIYVALIPKSCKQRVWKLFIFEFQVSWLMFLSIHVFQAVQLLKKGGVLVYSTCTVTLAENEEQVAWALRTFPCLSLQPQVRAPVTGASVITSSRSVFPMVSPQEPHVGAGGMLGAGLSPEQLRLLQRFRPELGWNQAGAATPSPRGADRDTIGFFIAKFLKT